MGTARSRQVAETSRREADSKVRKFVRAFEKDNRIVIERDRAVYYMGDLVVEVMGVKVGMQCDKGLCYRRPFSGRSTLEPRQTN